MKRIFKYELEITDRVVVSMPFDAKIISVADVRGTLCAYAMVSPNTDKRQREFAIIGTGNPLPHDIHENYQFIGTVAMCDGFVWHVFDKGWQ